MSAGEKEIPTVGGSYCWSGLLSSRCVDYVYANPLEMAKEAKTINIAPNEEIAINFKTEPLDGTYKIEQWIDDHRQKEIELNNGIFLAPSDKGLYIYYITARWKRGDGSYAFSIKVN